MPCVSVIILHSVLGDSQAKCLIINLLLVPTDVVVAINGVWILVETYKLNSKISPDHINTCDRG